MMKLSELADFLPHEMPADRFQEAMDRCYTDLGGDFLIFHRESYSPYDYGTQYLEFLYRPVKRTWAASCVCTACGDRFHLGWTSQSIPHDYCKNGVQRGVTMLVGPDETPYPGVPETEDSADVIAYYDNATLVCPSCGKSVTLKHKSAFRSVFDKSAICYRVIFGYSAVIQNRAALLFWTLERVIESDGNVTLTAKPERAVLIDCDGSLLSFRYDFRNGPARKGRWIPTSLRDPSQKHYASRGAFPSKCGAAISSRLPVSSPDFVGTSGEKTGLSAYLAGGGQFPVLYLKFWRQYPAIESVVKSGWIRVIDDAIAKDCVTSSMNCSSNQCRFPVTLEDSACWHKRKPCDILMMSRSEIRRFSDNQWDSRTLKLWISFRTLGLFRPDDAHEYLRTFNLYGYANLSDWLAVLRASGALTTFEKLERYLRRQCGDAIPLSNGLRLLIDYRDMLSNLDKLLGDDAPKSDLFPAKLHETHNRVAKQLAETKKEFCNVPYLQLRETWSALEWSDGEICAKLPLSEMDLVREGRTLHHCVGSYGNSHLAGRFVIFIRHARRPERSWYTLNVNTTGPEPTEIQLHGYRNDVVNGRSIPIPKRVRDFCNKWESEILLPVFRKVRASEKRKENAL